MEQHLILTIISDDKPGIVKQIAHTVSLHDGNWLESQLSQLAGKFAGVIRLSAPNNKIKDLESALNNLSSNNIHVQLEILGSETQDSAKRSANFSAAGPDRAGIVLEITQAFSEFNINVENLTTKCSSMPYSGEPLFEAEGELSLPSETQLNQLTEQLESIADQLGIDIKMEENTLSIN